MAETIGEFQILRRVAQSNTAEIFQAVSRGRRQGESCALKVLKPEFAADRVERDHLENEYRVTRGMSHPNLVSIHEIVLSAERPMLIMELVEGEAMRDHLLRGDLTDCDVVEHLGQVAAGLSYFHERGYVHLDVKPQNILIGIDRVARLIDFALARRAERGTLRRWVGRLLRRRRPGTQSYMAPEQIRRLPITPASDVYSLGVTLFEALTGRLPYSAESSEALLRQHLSARVPQLREVRPELPLALGELASAMMAKDPLDRPGSMEYVSGKLRDILRRMSPCEPNE